MQRRLLSLLLGLALLLTAGRPLPPPARAVAPPYRLLTGADADALPLPPAALARVGALRFRHSGAVEQLAFSKDGKYLFATASSGAVRLWEAATGRERALANLPTGKATALALAPDGRLLAVALASSEIVLYDLGARRVVSRWPSGLPCPSLAFSADSRSLLWLRAASKDAPRFGSNTLRAVVVRDLSRGTDRAMVGEIDRVDQVAFAPDGKTVATCSATYMQTFELATGKRARQYGERDNLMRVAFSRDGQSILTTSPDAVVVWERDALEEALRLNSSDRNGIRDLAVSPDGKSFAVTSATKVKIHQFPSGKERVVLDPKGEAVTALAFSPDGKSLATGDQTGQLRLWDLGTGKEKLPIGPRNAFAAVGLSADGRELVALDGQALTRWSLATGGQLSRTPLPAGLIPEAALVQQAALSPDGRFAAVWTKDNQLHLLDTARGALLHSPKVEASQEVSLAFTADSRHLAVALDRGEAKVAFLDTRTGRTERELPLPGEWAPGLALSGDGRSMLRVASTSYNTASLFRVELATGKARRDMPLPGDIWPRSVNTRNVRSAIISTQGGRGNRSNYPDGLPGKPALTADGRLAALPFHSRLFLIDTSRGRVLGRLEGGTEPLWVTAFSPDGALLAAAGDEGAIWLWDVRTMALRARLEGHRDRVAALVFTADGRRLLSASEDVTALVWDIDRALRLPRVVPPAATALPALWAELASDEPRQVDDAIEKLAAAPAASVPFLRKFLRPVPVVTAAVVQKWIDDLDSDKAAVREAAQRQLADAGDPVVPALEKAAASASAEVRRQAKLLLAKLAPPLLSGERARPLRAVEALERINTAEARGVLTELAGGATEARLTREAAAALRRLGPKAEP